MRQAYKSNAKSATPSAANQSAIGNPGEGTPATIIGDRWFWLATETIKRVIEEGGITPGDDPDELKDAILALVAGTSGLDTTAGDNRYLQQANNLSDVDNVGNARGSLSVYSRSQVDNAIDDLQTTIVGGAPNSRNTLDEVYDVLNAAIALKANRNNANLTGNARAPTPSAGDDSTRIATTAWLQSFFGGASRREFSTAGSHSYDWEWDVSNGLALIMGGAGGGGGGGRNGVGGGGGGGGGTTDGEDGVGAEGVGGGGAGGAGYRSGGDGGDGGIALPAGGGAGGGAGSTSAAIGGDTHVARGGGGGGGGSGSASPPGDGSTGGFDGGAGPVTSTSPGGGAGDGIALVAGEGGTGADNAGRRGSGGDGGEGEARLIPLTGLSLNDTFTITVGAGGGGGAAASGGNPTEAATAGTDGAAGHVILIPLY